MKTGRVDAVIDNKPRQHNMIAGLRHILRIIRHAQTQTIINMSNRHVVNIGAFERPADAASGAGVVNRKNNFGTQRQYLVEPLRIGCLTKTHVICRRADIAQIRVGVPRQSAFWRGKLKPAARSKYARNCQLFSGLQIIWHLAIDIQTWCGCWRQRFIDKIIIDESSNGFIPFGLDQAGAAIDKTCLC